MKALSVHPEPAFQIAVGQKTIEVRSWKTNFRGEIVICSTSNNKVRGTIPGHALCTVKLVDVRPLKRSDYKAACISPSASVYGLYAWVLDDNKLIYPRPVKGKLSLWEYPYPIKYVPDEEWVLLPGDDPHVDKPWFTKYWDPITTQ